MTESDREISRVVLRGGPHDGVEINNDPLEEAYNATFDGVSGRYRRSHEQVDIIRGKAHVVYNYVGDGPS